MNNMHHLLAEREQPLFKEKVLTAMKKYGMEYLILTKAENVFYITGYYEQLETGVAIVSAWGDITLAVSTLESQDARAMVPDEVEVREFMSYVFIDDGTPDCLEDKGDAVDPNAIFNIAMDIIKPGSITGKIGLEMNFITHKFWGKLVDRYPEEVLADCSNALVEARMIKTPWEIKMLRIGAQHQEKVFLHMGNDLKEGMPGYMLNKLFLYYSAQFDEEGTLGRQHKFVPAAGPYYGLCNFPRGYTLKNGDIVKFDCGFKNLGCNADIARTFAVGNTATDDEIEIYETLYHANRLGVSMLKPGIRCSDIYIAVRKEVEKSRLISKYPRGHVGHSMGSGISFEEQPTLASNTDIIIRPGMVFSLETPYSATGKAVVTGGFNIEDTFVITEDGYEAFTSAPGTLLNN